MFGKKKEQKKEPKLFVAEVVTMPQEFMGSEQDRGAGNGALARVMVVLLILVFVVGGTALVLYVFRDALLPQLTSSTATTDDAAVQDANANANAAIAVNEATNEATNTAINTTTVVPVNGAITNTTNESPTFASLDGATNTAVQPTNTTTPTTATNGLANIAPTNSEDALDGDGDGLTAAEETLWGTKAAFADSDTDGYDDGHEVAAGYDPLAGDGKTLAESTRVEKFINRQQGYALSYPKGFIVRSVNNDQTDVIFTLTSGEYIEVQIQDNRLGLSAAEWYQKINPAIAITEISRQQISGVEAAMSTNGRSVYIPKGGSMITIVYVLGSDGLERYATTFAFMYTSLDLAIPVTTAPAVTTNSAQEEATSNTPVTNTTTNASEAATNEEDAVVNSSANTTSTNTAYGL